MKVSELSGKNLDYWVAKAECLESPEISENLCQYVRHDTPGDDGWWTAYEASTEWSIAGPIIERERISLAVSSDGLTWYALIPSLTDRRGATPLIAAMRAYVASKYGDTVPEEVK